MLWTFCPFCLNMCLMLLQVPCSLHTDHQTPSSRSPSGSVTSTAASIPSSIHAPIMSLRKLSRVYLEFIVWKWLPDRSIIIWVQVKVKRKVTASPSPRVSTAGGLPVVSAPHLPWLCPELLPLGTAGNGRSLLEAQQADLDRLKQAELKWPNSAIKASSGPAAASSMLGHPRMSQMACSPLRPETFPPLKSTNCPFRKKESLYNHCNPSSISHDSLIELTDENISPFAPLTSQRMGHREIFAALIFLFKI